MVTSLLRIAAKMTRYDARRRATPQRTAFDENERRVLSVRNQFECRNAISTKTAVQRARRLFANNRSHPSDVDAVCVCANSRQCHAYETGRLSSLAHQLTTIVPSLLCAPV